ncbi:MAG: ribosome-associated translation inhibitor RaiA [Clostridiales bacterium]|jgi:putative sigma-54 modulation protein|nr:ribosome-associated translation inhibitor RaiA [Clostridiales bacterium]
MKITVIGKRGYEVKDEVKDWAESKFSKLEKFFKNEFDVKIVVEEKRAGINVEVTIVSLGVIYRAEVEHKDPLVAIDKCENMIDRQIRKNKTKLEKQLHNELPPLEIGEEVEEESEFNVVKSKTFTVKPMSVEEAILQMNLLRHTFFIFREAKSEKINLVYKRNDGDYGLIEI